MDLPGWSIYGPMPIKDFYLRNPLEGVVHEKKNHAEILFGRPENTMRCSEMVEVVE